MKKNQDYFKKHYLMSYKSINWWEEEIGEHIDFFERLEANTKYYNERIVEENKLSYAFLVGRGGFEQRLLDEIEKELVKYNASKKKK